MLIVCDSSLSEAKIHLPRPVSAADGYSLRVCLQSLTIPNTQLPINTYCNELVVNGLTGVVDSGNYSAAVLSLLLDGQFAGVTVSYDEIAGKMTISASSSIVLSGSILDVLDIAAGTGTSFTSQNNVDISGVKAIHVISDLQTEHISTQQVHGILASIQMAVPPFNVLYYRDAAQVQATTVGDRHIQDFTIKLVDDRWRPLLCNSTWTCVLDVEQVYSGIRDLKRERPISLTASYK